jgi:hypothetical protein
MFISIEHHEGKYPSFNINLHSEEGAEAFLSIKGCSIKSGAKGDFLSYPARKKDDGTWWKHVWGSDKFNANILKKAQQEKPVAKPKPKLDDEDLPF